MSSALARGLVIVLALLLVMPGVVAASDPALTNDSFSVGEDSGANVLDVLANDGSDAGANVIQSASDPAHGSTSTNGSTVTYTPAANYNGPDSFTYTVQNDDGQSTADVDITVDPDNDPPNAVNDNGVSVIEDTPKDIDVLGNDTDVDGDDPTISSVTSPGKGTATRIDGDTKVRYTPDEDVTGSDSFSYTISDGNGGQDTATVNLTISAVNDAPSAEDDSATVTEDTPEEINVLGNDPDVDDTVLDVVDKTNGTKGSVTIASNGQSVTYVPNPNAVGGDTFDYTISDGHLESTATVSVTITAVEDDPTAANDTYTIDEDATTQLDVRSNDDDVDGDGVSITAITTPTLGSASVQSGQIRYDPDQDVNGTDTFDYTIDDGHGGQDTATVTVHITAENDPPAADDDDFGVAEDSLANPLAVLAGDTDPDGDTLTIIAKTNGSKGTVAITGGGTGLTYKPGANLSGADSFTYTISDGHGEQDTATVTVEIGGANDPPNAVNDASMSVPEGAGASVLDVMGNDSDPDGDELVIASKTNGAHGTVTITGFGTGLTYNPSGNYHGSDLFTYMLSDGHGGTDSATVLVTVVKDADDPVISAPIARFVGGTVGTTTTKVQISWSGSDAGSGIHDYRLQMSTNGGSFRTVSLSSAIATSSTLSLKTGSTYRFRVRAADREGNATAYQYTPTFKVLRSGETSSSVAYVGTWAKSSTTNALGGTARYSGSAVKSATYTFNGTDVAWIATRTTSSGRARVLLDGVLVSTVDLDISKTKYKQLVFRRHVDGGGTHTLRIEPVGDGRVDIDGFVILR